jgi:peptide/nickel transport system ATP-binding protein
MDSLTFKISIGKDKQNLVSIDRFKLEKQKINFLLGESGIGKTLLSKTMYGLLDPAKLKININDIGYKEYLLSKQAQEIKKDGFFVFQEPSTHINPLLKIGTQLKEGNLSTGLNESELLQQLWPDAEDNHFLRLLKIYPKPYRPSGGEKQRFLLIMAFKKIHRFLNNKNLTDAIFIFDEPSGSLDDHLRNVFIQMLIEKYSEKAFTILFITHDYSIISEVVNHYPNIKNEIIFKELQKHGTSVKLQPFEPKAYISWLQASNRPTKGFANKTNKVLLSLNPEIIVFNRRIKIYKNSNVQQLSSLQIHEGEIVYLKAPSGAGKTTIAKIIMGLIKADKFELKIADKMFTQNTAFDKWRKKLWGKQITMTFQHADEALNLKSTVKQTLSNLPSVKRPDPAELLSTLHIIFDTEIDDSFLKKKISQLSGGQKQRLNLLRAFLLETPLLILDEPLNGLDFASIQKVINLLLNRKDNGAGILIISHNEEIIDTIVDQGNIYYLQ